MSKKINFYFINNFGGGAQTVERAFSYLNYLNPINKQNIHLQLNFRYLNFKEWKKSNFSNSEIDELNTKKIKLLDFIQMVGKKITKKYSLERMNGNQSLFTPEIMMDSGMGSILDYWINIKKLSIEEVIFESKSLVPRYLNFIKTHKPTFSVALDYCMKNTYKKNITQAEKENYLSIINKLVANKNEQNGLLIKQIEFIRQNNLSIKLLAPIHGNDIDDYISNYEKLINIEKLTGYKFDGFALGGLAKFKQSHQISKIVKKIRDFSENRKIHILGSSGIDKILLLIYSGADSFDCNSLWRRANDPVAKILVPLLDKNLNFNSSNKNLLKYLEINKIKNKEFNCTCPICEEFPISVLKKLYSERKTNRESYYFATIMISLHAVYQHQYLIDKLKKISTNEKLYLDFIESIPDYELKKKIKTQYERLVN